MEGFPIYYGGGTIKECMNNYRATGPCLDKFYRTSSPTSDRTPS